MKSVALKTSHINTKLEHFCLHPSIHE